jgi:hypothetical protein
MVECYYCGKKIYKKIKNLNQKTLETQTTFCCLYCFMKNRVLEMGEDKNGNSDRQNEQTIV